MVIQGGIVGHGFAFEIEDRGLGMNDEKLAEANEQLAEPRPFDPANTDRPTSVADLAADLDLPVGVIRILLGDLRE